MFLPLSSLVRVHYTFNIKIILIKRDSKDGLASGYGKRLTFQRS